MMLIPLATLGFFGVEVLNNVNKLRLSPVLVAAVAVSASLGFSHPANGKTADDPSADSEQLDVQNTDVSRLNADKLQQQDSFGNLAIASHSSPLETATAIPTVPQKDSNQPKGAQQVSLSPHTLTLTPTELPSQSGYPRAVADLTLTASPESPSASEPKNHAAIALETPLKANHPHAIEALPETPSLREDARQLKLPTLAVAAKTAPLSPEANAPGTPSASEIRRPEAPAIAQETPDRIQLETNPSRQAPGTINLEIPQQQPTPPPIPSPNVQPAPAPTGNEPRVLVSEIVVRGVQGELENIVYDAIITQPGQTTTRSQLQQDINAIFATGFFSQVRVEPQDTPLGVRVTFVVEPNPILREVQAQGTQVLPATVVNEIFGQQYGQILNFRQLQDGIRRLNQWYQQRGYVLAQVVDSRVSENGVVTLEIAEGVVEEIQVRFLNREGEPVTEQGEPVRGRTRPYIIQREMAIQRGEVFNRQEIQQDLQRVFGLGLFEDVQLSLNPGENPRQVVVVVNVKERSTGSIAAGAGFSSASGLFGSASYQQTNLGGNNQRVGVEAQLGQREFLFDVRFTDPWIGGDPYRTSYTVNFFRRRSISLIFEGGDDEVNLPNGDRPRILRLGGGVTFVRPLSPNPLERSDWQASLGLQYQRVSIIDRDGEVSPRDELGNDLSFSGEGKDDLFTVQLGAVRDVRNDRLRPTSGSLLRFGVEQSVPIGLGSIFLTRLRGSYTHYVPVRFTNFTQGPQALAFNLQAGTVLFDLPPYEAFALGGSNSVRGYQEGELGSGRSYVQASAEYRFPIFGFAGGVLFFDIGSDLGTAEDVPGRPAIIRDKPGAGYGYGVGVRIQSPLGPLRIDYGINDEGDSRIHFGIGERF